MFAFLVVILAAILAAQLAILAFTVWWIRKIWREIFPRKKYVSACNYFPADL